MSNKNPKKPGNGAGNGTGPGGAHSLLQSPAGPQGGNAGQLSTFASSDN